MLNNIMICIRLYFYYKETVGMGCRIKANCPLVEPGPTGGMPSVSFFLRDPSPYLRVRRKLRKTPIGKVEKCDRGLNLAPLIYHF